jgi:hypothetical protein
LPNNNIKNKGRVTVPRPGNYQFKERIYGHPTQNGKRVVAV